MKIKCYTLFDITKTNVSSRRYVHERDGDIPMIRQRAQQSNFETVLQIIGMRAQPEDFTAPEKDMISLKTSNWGSQYTNKTKIPCWSFTFVVDQPSVFHDGISDVGNLTKDSHGIPIIIGLEEWSKITNTIDTSPEFRNIYFEIQNEA